ncbi:MAG TPA: hypothetical protein PLC29_10300 [Prolixibacteraceae bacterium]|jgi:hypothetical protein|nr:hypothetical protein [Prolixibacteraceae bacterium]OQB79489.1 MAG: hypothetical protein BWX87_02063 [Bacteroidetes bacterium ADurb.Bin123]HNZ69781.1 hypothetical protein [Prolixibacteraceae bacterium]HOC86769.1 hypothetical protein [Prolixibacteraceae bacterium]HOG96662.1 hypothetical protein [Prolixibacteraceae bacterium]
MKTTTLKPRLSGLPAKLSLFATIFLLALSGSTQSVWEVSEVKAGETVFFVDKIGTHLSVRNSNYIEPMNTRDQYNWDALEFSYVSMISHDPFLEAFKQSFTAGRLKQLATLKDNVTVIFDVDEKGQILGVHFLLLKETTILPEELEMLEREMLSRVKFVVIGKKLEGMFFHRVSIWVFFSEVLNVEIRPFRYSVNLKNSYQE